MTAQIAGFVTRAEADLVQPKSVSRNIRADLGGVASHWFGGAQRLEAHTDCIARWRAAQGWHMRPGGLGVPSGAADIAYTGGTCDHGYAFAGRGAGIRSGAQGTNDGNWRFYAIAWLGGKGETPTPEALDAFDWWVAELKRIGAAGSELRPHNFFKRTECPGPDWADHIRGIPVHPEPPPPTPPPPPPPATDWTEELIMSLPTLRRDAGYASRNQAHLRPAVRRAQGLLLGNGHKDRRSATPETATDGFFGPGTETATRGFQKAARITVDGIIGRQTYTKLLGQ